MTAPAKFEPDRVTDSGRPSATPNVGGLAIRRNGASPGPPMAGLARRSGPERVPADGSDAIAGQSQPGATLPSTLRAMVRRASGVATDDVRVHYNSPEPAQLNALAYTQGSEIHLGPGQEHALGHEVTHVVQQKQGRVRRTTTVHGLAINDDAALEQEADGAQLGRPAGPVVPATEALQLLKAKIPGSAPNAVVTVADVRARLALFRAQVEEYRNYPDEVAAADGAVLASVEQRVDRAQVLFGEIVRDLPLADGAQITAAAVRGHYGDTAKLTELGGCLKDTRAAINARYDAWETWHYTNPDSLAELDAATVKTGAELGLAGEEGVRYGKYDGGGIFKVIGDALPQPADRDAADDDRRRRKHQRDRRRGPPAHGAMGGAGGLPQGTAQAGHELLQRERRQRPRLRRAVLGVEGRRRRQSRLLAGARADLQQHDRLRAHRQRAGRALARCGRAPHRDRGRRS